MVGGGVGVQSGMVRCEAGRQASREARNVSGGGYSGSGAFYDGRTVASYQTANAPAAAGEAVASRDGRSPAACRRRREELGEFLKSRRGRLSPEDSGLPGGSRRRGTGRRAGRR